MTLYGLYGFTHGGARVLTVMGPAGASAARAFLHADDDVIVYAGAGRLPQYHEKRAGALRRLVADNKIAILTKEEWDVVKSQLGKAAYR